MREFVVPKTDTRILGKIHLDYAFKLTAHYDPPQESHTPRGTFRYQDITGGEVSGERISATVYPDSGGQYEWMNNTTFVVSAKESADQREVVFYYYIAN